MNSPSCSSASHRSTDGGEARASRIRARAAWKGSSNTAMGAGSTTRRDRAPLCEESLVAFTCPAVKMAIDEATRRVAQQLGGSGRGSTPSQIQEMFALRYGEGLRLREIADYLGLSESAVKKRFSRTLRELRERSRNPSTEVDYAT